MTLVSLTLPIGRPTTVSSFRFYCTDNDGLGDYFNENWFNITEMWSTFYRSELFTMGNNTTNRIER